MRAAFAEHVRREQRLRGDPGRVHVQVLRGLRRRVQQRQPAPRARLHRTDLLPQTENRPHLSHRRIRIDRSVLQLVG